MNPGPIPPHERTWRHPSEVAAAQRAELHATPPGRDAQRLAIGAGACVVALVIVAMLATISTQKSTAPLAKVQASVPILAAQISVPSVGSLPGEPITISHVESLRPSQNAVPCLATPISSGQLALVTAACLREDDASSDETATSNADRSRDQDEILVTLPDQSEQFASPLHVDTANALDGLSIVSLSTPVEPVAVARTGLSAADSLALVGSRHLELSLSELIEIPLADGTPVLNQDGELVAVSSETPAGVSVLISIDRESLNQVLAQVANGPQNPTVSSGPPTSSSALTYSRAATDSTGD